MDIKWRLVQIFVDLDGVSEVSIATHDKKKISCTCPGFSSTARCKHVRYVRASMAENNGEYIVQIPDSVSEEDALRAMLSEDTWREFIRKYAVVESID